MKMWQVAMGLGIGLLAALPGRTCPECDVCKTEASSEKMCLLAGANLNTCTPADTLSQRIAQVRWELHQMDYSETVTDGDRLLKVSELRCLERAERQDRLAAASRVRTASRPVKTVDATTAR